MKPHETGIAANPFDGFSFLLLLRSFFAWGSCVVADSTKVVGFHVAQGDRCTAFIPIRTRTLAIRTTLTFQ